MPDILDIGAGATPWLCRQLYLNGEGRPSDISKWLEGELLSLPRYWCLDTDYRGLVHSRSEVSRIHGSELLGFLYIQSSGTMLPLASGMFDIVILSDVLCSPEVDYCQCLDGDCDQRRWCTGRRMVRGISTQGKRDIVREAYRVLKPRGFLAIGIYQTPWLAAAGMQEIHALEQLGLLSKAGKVDRRPEPYFSDRVASETLYRKK